MSEEVFIFPQGLREKKRPEAFTSTLCHHQRCRCHRLLPPRVRRTSVDRLAFGEGGIFSSFDFERKQFSYTKGLFPRPYCE